MADRKAVNKYYPPEWDPSKGSINKFQNSHPLRERARKLHLGILVIRFEMPYNIWCDGCNNHIGTGVRYNAEKSKTGMYYSTPIYKFRMKCHLCDNHFEMQTDPANLDYVILNGARRQERRWDPEENEQVAPEDRKVTRQLTSDAMFRLEHDADDKKKSVDAAPRIRRLEGFQDRFRDDYAANSALRARFRQEKKVRKAKASADARLLARSALAGGLVKLLEETEEDRKVAQLIRLAPNKSFDERQKEIREDINSRALIPAASSKKTNVLTRKIVQDAKLAKIVKLTKPNVVAKLGVKSKRNPVTTLASSSSSSGLSSSLVDYDGSSSSSGE